MSFNPNIDDDHIHSASFTQGIPDSTDQAGASKTGPEDGVSTIEESKNVAPYLAPLISFPLLDPPQDAKVFEAIIQAVASGTHQNQDVIHFLMSEDLKVEEMKNQILDAWSKNLRDIEEQVRQLINSPMYQELQAIRVRGSQEQGAITGIPTATSANAIAANPAVVSADPLSFVSAIDRLHAYERVPPAATIPDPSDPTDIAKTLTIPLVGALFIGGSLALGSVELSATVSGLSGSSPLVGAVELVELLQPFLPQIVPNMIPMINLLVMPLVYYTSWNQAIGSLRNKEAADNKSAIQEFAKQVIKMVSDPTFILANVVNRMAGADQLSPQLKEQLAAMLKLVLASVALSLLYSFDVGKVQGQAFWGMEPQEFQGILSGQIPSPDPSDPKLTTQAHLTATVLGLVRAQMALVPAGDRSNIIALLFDYIPNSRDLKRMLDPNKVFQDILHSSQFNPEVAGLEGYPV